jgi:hypothetical protein
MNDNSIRGFGDNRPPLPALISAVEGDFAALVTEYLDDVYGKHVNAVDALLDECAALVKDPETGKLRAIEDDEMKGKVASLIKRLRDQAKLIDGIHAKEKQAYMRGGQAVDQFCFKLIDRLAKRDRKNRDGAADILGSLLTAYDERKLAEERERRRLAEERARREAEEARRRQEAEAKAAEEARLAAERARKPEIVAAKTTQAESQEQRAAAANIDATIAEARMQEAHVATLARPADIMRTRGDDGTLSTMGTEKFAEVVDRDLLDKEALWPFLNFADIERALRGWAKVNDYNRQMPGASIGRRNRSVVR